MMDRDPHSVESKPRLSRRQFIKGAALLLGGLSLAACSPAKSGAATGPSSQGALNPSTAGKLTVWGWAGTYEGIRAMVPKFNAVYPNITVEITEQGYDDIHTNLLNAIVSGTGAPDICAIDCLKLWNYTDGLADLTAQASQLKDLFVEPTFSVGSFRGKFYGISTDSEPMGLFYRSDLWEKYGIQPEKIQTWADLAAASNHLAEATNGDLYLYHMNSGIDDLFEILALQAGFPGFYFSEDDTRVVVDDPKLIAAAETMKQLWDAKAVLRNPVGGSAEAELTSSLKNGKLISQIIAPAWYPLDLESKIPEQSGKWRLMRAPALQPGGKRIGYAWPTVTVIPQQSQLKEFAWELAKMSLIGDGAKALYNEAHILPAYRPLMDEIKDQPAEYFGGQKINQIWMDIATDTPPVTFGYGFDEAGTIIGAQLQEILDGKITAEAGMQAAAKEIRSRFKKA